LAQAGKLVCTLACMVEGMLAGKLERILVRKQVCMLVQAVDMQERMAEGIPEHMLVGKLACTLEHMVEGKPACILERMEQAVGIPVCKQAVRIQARMVDHSIQVMCRSNDCRSIPPIGALS
jgi:hypothetical protein